MTKSQTPPRQLLQRLPLGLIAASAPAWFALWFILHYAFNFPFLDEWDEGIAGVIIKAHQGQLSFADLYAQHNEHRIFMPRLVYLAMAWLTNWNSVAVMLCGWGMLCMTSIGVLALARRTLRGPAASVAPADATNQPALGHAPGSAVAPAWFLCNLLIFTPAQWQNLIWGINVQNFMPAMFLVAAMLVVGWQNWALWRRALLAGMLATMATYASGNGMLTWPLVGVLLAWPDQDGTWRDKRAVLIGWSIAAVLCIGSYFVNYVRPTHGGAEVYAREIGAVIQYFLVFLGMPFCSATSFPPIACAMTIGMVLLIVFASCAACIAHAFLKRGQRDLPTGALVWILIGLWTLMNAAMTAIARAGAGVGQATNSRYATMAVYLTLALIFLVPLVYCDFVRRRPEARRFASIPGVLAGALIVLQLLTLPLAGKQAAEFARQQRQAKSALLFINIIPDNPQIEWFVLPDLVPLQRRANALSKLGYVRPPLIETSDARALMDLRPDAAELVQGRFERSGPRSAIEAGAAGWAVFPHQSSPADAVLLSYEDERGTPVLFAFADVGIARNEIAQRLGEEYTKCGWSATFPIARLPRGKEAVTLRAWAFDCDTGKTYLLPGVGKISTQ